MQNTVSKIATVNWQAFTEAMHDKGFAIIEAFLPMSNAKN